MGYKADLDYDNDRLPHGMTRVGYDESTQIYTYRDSDGSYWQGPPGSRYGTLYRVSKAAAPRLPSFSVPEDNEEDEEDETPVSSPTAARPHNHHPILRHHRLSGTTIASDNDTDADTFSYSYSFPDADYDEKHPIPSPPHTPTTATTPLKRAGTLSRLTRFLSTPPSASRSQRQQQQRPNQALSRRATVTAAEGAGGYGQGHGAAARRQSYQGWTGNAAGTGDANGVGVGSGGGAAAAGGVPPPPVVRRKRATTFDEILAGI